MSEEVVGQSAGGAGEAEPRAGVAVPESPLEDIPPDASILVSGPSMTGKYELMLGLLAARSDRIVVVSTKNGASRVIDDLTAITGGIAEKEVGVIDCVSHHDAVDDVADTERLKYVGSPENLTRIGVKFTELYETFSADGDGRAGVGIHSLSQLLVYTDVKKVYKFLQVLTSHIRNAGWLGVAVVDDAVVDDQDLQTLKHHFDGVVETRENDAGRREFRVRGVTSPSSWTEF